MAKTTIILFLLAALGMYLIYREIKNEDRNRG